MSKLSFRARALDAWKPLPVFRCEDLPDLHEYALDKTGPCRRCPPEWRRKRSRYVLISSDPPPGPRPSAACGGGGAQTHTKWPPSSLRRRLPSPAGPLPQGPRPPPPRPGEAPSPPADPGPRTRGPREFGRPKGTKVT